MGYLHIENLYKDQTILMFRECYAMEKVHGTSTHLSFRRQGASVIDMATGAELNNEFELGYFSGGCNHENFKSVFDEADLLARHKTAGYSEMIVFGEGYGGKMQGMSNVYGKEMRFIAFDVKMGDRWLAVPQAEMICQRLGLEFVPYERVSTDLAALDAERDRPSEVAKRRGMGDSHTREGVVLRPIIEFIKNNGGRVIAKHKHPKFGETAEQRAVNPEQLRVLKDAEAIAEEWVTVNRLANILSHLPPEKIDISHTGEVIKLVIADVEREAEGEIVTSKAAQKAIGKRAAKLFKQHFDRRLREAA